MNSKDENQDLGEAIKRADLSPKRKAFKNHLPYAILRDGKVTLVFPDKHTEIATLESLEELNFTQA
jgi:hypothetical protein